MSFLLVNLLPLLLGHRLFPCQLVKIHGLSGRLPM